MSLIKANRLKRFINNSALVLYGIGEYGKAFYNDLKRYDIGIEFFIVSHLETIEKYDGVPVRDLLSCVNEIKENNIYVLVSVGESLEKEIEKKLIENHIISYDFAKNYIRNKYGKMSFSQNDICWRDEIIDWCVDEQHWNAEDAEALIMTKHKKKECFITIIFIDFSPRVIKITQALLKQKYVVDILLPPTAYLRSVCVDFLETMNIAYKRCEYMEELFYYMLSSSSSVFHLFSNPWRNCIAKIIISQKTLFEQIIVYDEYDIISGLYMKFDKDMYALEKYCLENAKAICNRGYEKDYLIKEMNYEIHGCWLQFPDYCKDEEIPQIKQRSHNLKDVSLCYVGKVAPEEYYPHVYCNSFLQLGRICELNKCHLHIYPTDYDENKYKDFIEISEKSDYFHFHMPVPYDELEKEIVQYDYGCIPMRRGYEKIFNHNFVNVNHFMYCTTNKLYDYIDAGLPIVAAYPVEAIRELENEHVVFPWTNEEIDFDILRAMKNKMKINVFECKKRLKISRQVGRLIKFYKKIQVGGDGDGQGSEWRL